MPAERERAPIEGRLVLEDRVARGRLHLDDGLIVAVELEEGTSRAEGERELPYVLPGFVDVHVHGSGGHDAMGGLAALSGMARALLRRGVTSFLPTAVTAPLADLRRFADNVRAWLPGAPADGAQPLGFNLEGPFLAPDRRGAHDARHLRRPADVSQRELEPLLEGLRVITVAPDLAGASELIGWLAEQGVVVSLGHSAADYETSLAAYRRGARSTTHLFNAMSGLHHRAPGLAGAALTTDAAYVELIADGQHVDRALWPLIARSKPAERLLLVSDAVALAGTGESRGEIGGLAVEIVAERATLAGTDTLAGSLIALDTAARNFARVSGSLERTSRAAATNALEMLGVSDRGRLAVGQRADLVELDSELRLIRVMRAGEWLVEAG